MLNKASEKHMFSDATFRLLCSQIDSDYTSVIRRDILPRLNVDKSIRLRELRTLMVIESFDRAMSSASIAQYLRFDKGTVSRAVKILKDQGYVGCLDNHEDKRSPLLVVTEKGQLLAKAYTSKVNSLFPALSDTLGKRFTEDERKIVLEALYLLRDRVHTYSTQS